MDPKKPFSLLKPLSLWELGVSRFGVFPEMQTFGLRCCHALASSRDRYRFDIVFDNQCLSWGLLGIQAAGTPVVSVIHHPLHIDREADFAESTRVFRRRSAARSTSRSSCSSRSRHGSARSSR